MSSSSACRLIIVLALTFPSSVSAQVDSFELERKQYIIEVTKYFINLIKNNQRNELAEHTHYPLRRQHPVPNITSKQDFLTRYNEVFDDSIVKIISASNPKEDWGLVGWRGIMFLSGQVWLSEDGFLIAVNYQSPAEKKKRGELIEAERKTLHPSLRGYKSPVCIFKTTQNKIRIDELSSGKFRYTSWPIKRKMSKLPALNMIGEMEYDGNGGNRFYIFKNGEYTYKCYIILMGRDDDPPAEISITNRGQEIIHQNATLIGN